MKMVRWGDGGPGLRSIDWELDWEHCLRAEADLQGSGALAWIAISSVVGEGRRKAVARVCEQLARRVWVNPVPDLFVDSPKPDAVGRDRLFAASGAWQVARGPGIVVDAGTALTVDALGVRGGKPAFLGGAIAPGPALLARALADGGAQLFEVQVTAQQSALGRDTLGALRAGIGVGFQGAARELVRRVSGEAGLGDAVVYVTGGARSLLLADGLLDGRNVVEDPYLVHRGLLACAPGQGES